MKVVDVTIKGLKLVSVPDEAGEDWAREVFGSLLSDLFRHHHTIALDLSVVEPSDEQERLEINARIGSHNMQAEAAHYMRKHFELIVLEDDDD